MNLKEQTNRIKELMSLIKEIREKTKEDEKHEDFAETRLGGAAKISENAKSKGGLALLTWHHFKVKIPYYKKASKGKLDINETQREYKKLLDELYDKTKNKKMNITQIEFQQLVGKLEVLGELLIENNN